MDVKDNTKAENSKQLEAFSAISSFVNDLWDAFGNVKKASPLALYHRLVEGIKITDKESIKKTVDGFKTFLKQHELSIMKGDFEAVPQGTVIPYGANKRICIEIQSFFYRSRNDKDTLEVIKRHLLTIGMILDPREDKMTELENSQKTVDAMAEMLPGLDMKSKEGQFINDILENAKTSLQDIDTSNPMTAMMAIYNSGALQKMMTGMQTGEMNPKSLAKMMKKTLNTLLPDDEDDDVPAPTPVETPTLVEAPTEAVGGVENVVEAEEAMPALEDNIRDEAGNPL